VAVASGNLALMISSDFPASTSFFSNFLVSASEEVCFLSPRTSCSFSLETGCPRAGSFDFSLDFISFSSLNLPI